MARGSLYYHFGDKKGLFRAVYEELMTEMTGTIKGKIASGGNSWEKLMTGCLVSLDLLMQQAPRRIVIDVHTALTYSERLEILGRTLLVELHTLLQQVLAAGYFKGHDQRSLAVLIFGILSEGGRSFELAEDVTKARQDFGNSFTLFMEKARA